MGPHALCATVTSTPGINTLVSVHRWKVSKTLLAEFVFFQVSLGWWRANPNKMEVSQFRMSNAVEED